MCLESSVENRRKSEIEVGWKGSKREILIAETSFRLANSSSQIGLKPIS